MNQTMTYQSVSPNNGKLLHTFAEQSDEQLEAALAAAARFEAWRTTTSAERAAIVARVIGGRRIERPDLFMQPTNLAGITWDNPAFDEEFFGRVALFFRVADEYAAVALANGSPFGLGGSVFIADMARGKHVAARIEIGMVFINHPTWTTPDLPFGDLKDSSYGREPSGMGIQEFANKRLVRITATSNAA